MEETAYPFQPVSRLPEDPGPAPTDMEPELTGTAPRRPNKDRHDWDELLHPSLKVTKFDVFLMVLHIVIRHGQTGPLVEDLLKFVNVIVGQNAIPTSKYVFSGLYEPKDTLFFHYFCPECNTYLDEKSTFDSNCKRTACPSCGEICPVGGIDGKNLFVSLSVRNQLEQLLKRPHFHVIPHLDRPEGFFSDVMDGELYRSMCKEGMPLANPNALTVTFNTDGVEVFESVYGSLWPILMIVNETRPEDRFRPENVLLAGLYFGEKSPNMSMFLKPFVKEFQDLAVNGVKHSLPDGTEITRQVYAILCSLDSVAKPKVADMTQFNGADACGYCEHPNIPVEGLSNPRYLANKEYKERTHEGMLRDMQKADALARAGKPKAVNGIRGISILVMLPLFHAVFGFGIDYFHAVLEGVMSKLCDLWFGTGNSPYVISDKIVSISSRLTKIKPPNILPRPRSLLKRPKLKAKEWRAFLLYYALPCLSGVLPPVYFEHFKCLVKAMHILLSESIPAENLREAARLLKKFVWDFNTLYGDRSMVYNTHLCSHYLARMTENYGGLMNYSTFPFESTNGFLLKLTKGTRGVVHQIARKYVTARNVPMFCRKYRVTEGALKFCSYVFSYDYLKYDEKFDDVTALGYESLGELSQPEVSALQSMNTVFDILPGNKFVYFKRVVRKGALFYSRSYSKPQHFDDSCVTLDNGSYAIIDKIIKSSCEESALFALVKPIRLSDHGSPIPQIKCCAQDMYGDVIVVPFCSVKVKCVLVSVEGGSTYVCDIPNFFERE